MDYLVYLQILVSLILFGMVIKRYLDSRRPPPAQAQAPAASADTEPLTPDAVQDPGRNWRQALPPPPPKKPWWRLYGNTLGMALFGLAFTSNNAWFVHSNPPPLFEELHMQQVQVLGWQRTHPQLHVRLPDGHSRMVEFPTFNLRAGRIQGDVYYVISLAEQRQLVGQTCQIWGRPLRFSIQDSYQVFALECDKGGRLRFDEAVKDYENDFKLSLPFTFPFSIYIWLFGVLLVFWAESYANRKVRLALQTPSSSTASSKAQP